MQSVGVAIVTAGRSSFQRALDSATLGQIAGTIAGDTIVVVGNGSQPAVASACQARGVPYIEGENGRGDLHYATAVAALSSDWFIWLEETDMLMEGAVAHIRHRLEQTPDRPHIFWREQRNGEKQNLVVARRDRLGRWDDPRGWMRATLDGYGPNAAVSWGTTVYLIKPFPDKW